MAGIDICLDIAIPMNKLLFEQVEIVVFPIISILFCVWIIFIGGADRLENTLVGYIEVGIFGEKAIFIKVIAWVDLLSSVVWLFQF